MLDTLVLNKLLPSNPWSTYDVLPWQASAKNQIHLSKELCSFKSLLLMAKNLHHLADYKQRARFISDLKGQVFSRPLDKKRGTKFLTFSICMAILTYVMSAYGIYSGTFQLSASKIPGFYYSQGFSFLLNLIWLIACWRLLQVNRNKWRVLL